MGKEPAFQFYPGDWTRDLGDFPLEIEGAWIRICCRLHWSETYGIATKSLKDWSKILQSSTRKTSKLLQIILTNNISSGKFLDNQNITIISRRMVKDSKIRQIRRESGKLGGNPSLLNEQVLLNQNSEVRLPHRDNQKPTPSSSPSVSSLNEINTPLPPKGVEVLASPTGNNGQKKTGPISPTFLLECQLKWGEAITARVLADFERVKETVGKPRPWFRTACANEKARENIDKAEKEHESQKKMNGAVPEVSALVSGTMKNLKL